MSALGLSQETIARSSRGPKLKIGVAASLSFVALTSLIFNTLFGPFAALLFLISGGVLLLTRPMASLQAVLRFWYLLILPLFCLLSVLWSQFPVLSLRYSVQLAITIVIAIAIANRISAAAFLRCLFGIYGVGILGSLLFGSVRSDIGAWIGIFGSKNAFAAVVCGFALTSIAVMFDRKAPKLMRLVALAGVASAGPLLFKAQSTGAMIFMIPASAIALAVMLSRRLNNLQKLTMGALLVTLGIAMLIIVLQYSEILFQNLLDASGKDVTLTGRTELWQFGAQFIREHPLLGVGYRAFWVHEYPPAELLWAIFDIQARSGFNFHNTYVNNAVEIGFIGLGIQVVILYGTLLKTYVLAFRSPSPETAFLAAFLTLVVCGSFLEVTVFFEFSITSVIVICAFVFATRANAKLSIRQLRGRSSKTPPMPLGRAAELA